MAKKEKEITNTNYCADCKYNEVFTTEDRQNLPTRYRCYLSGKPLKEFSTTTSEDCDKFQRILPPTINPDAHRVTTERALEAENEQNLKHQVQINSQHINEAFGYISRYKGDIDKVTSEIRQRLAKQVIRLDELVDEVNAIKYNSNLVFDHNKEIKTLQNRIEQLETIIKNSKSEPPKFNEDCLTTYLDDIKEEITTQYDEFKPLENYTSSDYKEKYATTFGDLKIGDKFIFCYGGSIFIKAKFISENKNLAYDTKTFMCLNINDTDEVIRVKDGDS